jgi:hypothetical protein
MGTMPQASVRKKEAEVKMGQKDEMNEMARLARLVSQSRMRARLGMMQREWTFALFPHCTFSNTYARIFRAPQKNRATVVNARVAWTQSSSQASAVASRSSHCSCASLSALAYT